MQILLKYLLHSKSYNYLNLNLYFSKWTDNSTSGVLWRLIRYTPKLFSTGGLCPKPAAGAAYDPNDPIAPHSLPSRSLLLLDMSAFGISLLTLPLPQFKFLAIRHYTLRTHCETKGKGKGTV